MVVSATAGACHRAVEETPEPSPEARRFAAALCEAADTCACSGPFAETGFCESEHLRWFAALEDTLEFDEDCLERWLAGIEHSSCPAPGAAEWDDALSCTVFRGDKARGAVCRPHPEVGPLSAEECAEGLRCSRGVCIEQGETTDVSLSEGSACDPLTTPACGGSSSLYCDAGVCRTNTVDGQTCDSVIECESASYCKGAWSGDGSCTVKDDVGDACDPRDQLGCFNYSALEPGGDPTQVFAWCDPAVERCVEGRGPRVCGVLNSHLPRP